MNKLMPIFLFLITFSLLVMLFPQQTFAQREFECGSSYTAGKCTPYPPIAVDCDGPNSGAECCAKLAADYSAAEGQTVTASCGDLCYNPGDPDATCDKSEDNDCGGTCGGKCGFCCNYTVSTPTPGGPTRTPTPTILPTSTPTPGGPTPTPTPALFDILGRVWIDSDGDGLVGSKELSYTGGTNVSATGPTPKTDTTNAKGNYFLVNLDPGSYTITLSVPAGYKVTTTNPVVRTLPPNRTVRFGIALIVPPTPTPTITPTPTLTPTPAPVVADPWFQSTGLNMRIDDGFIDKIPSTALPAAHASLVGTGGTGTPGIIFSGTAKPDFGPPSSQASDPSSYNWQTGDFPTSTWKRDVYTDSRNSVPTSYDFLHATAQSSGITVTDIDPFCTGGISSCDLDASLTNGVYIANGSLTLVGGHYSFLPSKNFIILVDGDLTIEENIVVPVGSTVVFSVTENIIVDKAVTSIDGLYSADKNFTVEGTPAGGDSPIIINGTAVANAALNGGSFQNERNLLDNSTVPSVSFVERPDFIVNYPDFVKHSTRVWQEVAP